MHEMSKENTKRTRNNCRKRDETDTSNDNPWPTNVDYYIGGEDEDSGNIKPSEYDQNFEGTEVYDITTIIDVSDEDED